MLRQHTTLLECPMDQELQEKPGAQVTPPGRRLKRGYDTRHLTAEIRNQLKAFEETCLPLNVIEAVLTILSIVGAALIAVAVPLWLVGIRIPGVAVVSISLTLYIVACVFIARQQRGLELMVHDASHRAWDRSNPGRNDRLANLLVAYPVLSTMAGYWRSHAVHHGQYGSHLDPCRRRFAKMGLGHLDLSTRGKIMKAVLRWLPSYTAEYYKEVGSASLEVWVRFVAWHLMAIVGPTAVILVAVFGHGIETGVEMAIGAWAAFWLIPTLTALTVLRSIAEAEEHDYERGNTEFDTTYTNLGWWQWILFHPKNDAYHLVHHMFPQIPERVHHKVHALLAEHDPKYRAALHRHNVLERL